MGAGYSKRPLIFKLLLSYNQAVKYFLCLKRLAENPGKTLSKTDKFSFLFQAVIECMLESFSKVVGVRRH